MAVQSIECQLAQAQLGRYIQGDKFSPDAQKHLEDHLHECPICSEVLSARRRALVALLTAAEPTLDSSTETAEEARKRALRAAMINRIRDQYNIADRSEPVILVEPEALSIDEMMPEAPVPISKPIISTHALVQFRKPLMFSGALVAVLIVMNVILRDPTSLLGKRSHAVNPPGVTTSSESAIRVAEPFTFDQVVPGPFLAAVEDFDESASSIATTGRNTSDLLKDTSRLGFSAPAPTAPTPKPQARMLSAQKSPVRRHSTRRSSKRAFHPSKSEPSHTVPSGVAIYPPEN